jgi:hypothetical protein
VDFLVNNMGSCNAPAHHGLSFLRTTPHVLALPLTPLNGLQPLLLLLSLRKLLCCALSLSSRLTGDELFLSFHERVRLDAALLEPLSGERSRW